MALAISTVLVTSLTACGDGNGGEAEEVVTPVEAQPMLSELELEILNLETKYNKGEFTGADYLALADAYSRAGDIRKQRDMLEQDYRLYEDADAFSTLQGLSVNLEEETEEIRSRAQEMLNDLELPEYLDESVNLIDSADWFSTMMPKLKEGQRSYYLERDAQPLFYAQVGYTGEGQRFSKVWYTGSETKRFLSQEGATIRLVTVTAAGADENIADPAETENPDATQETGTTEARARENTTTEISDTTAPRAATPADMDAWNGTFESWSVDCATGSITHEQGTMQNGVLTGDYTCDVHAGEGGLDAFSLWNNREGMEYITYTGSFDSEGKVLTEQPSEEIRKKLLEGTNYTDLILYAYDATGENCLWQGIGAETSVADYRFGGEMIGLETRPEYTSYEVTETMAAETDGTGTAGETGADGAGNTDASNGGAEATSGETAGTTDSGNPQIRIFDGEIQWFDGKYWVSAGNVKEMAKQDPFAAYEENHDTTTSGDTAGSTGSITGSITGNAGGNTTTGNAGQNITGGNTTGTAGGNKNSGTIQKPAATPKPTTKPSATKPGTTKPAATPAPTATPAPAATSAPAQNNDNSSSGGSGNSGSSDSGSSGGSSSDNGSTGGGSDSGSSSGGSSDSGSSGGSDSGSTGGDSGTGGGSDVDMEWTPDLL